jgi:hypothetical protein
MPSKSRPMIYTPRTIALVCELFHPPVQPDPSPIQRLHNQMFQSGDPLYSSFAVTPAGAVLSNPVTQPGANSYAAFLPDRFQFREELSGLTHDGFAARVKRVSEDVSRLCGIQIFTAEQVTVRTLVNPRNFKDSRAYLKQGMFGFDDEMQAFGREPQLYGIRLVFPPESPASKPEADSAQTCAFSLRIESFNNDPRSLFIENQGSFGPIMVEHGLETVEQNIVETYNFVVQNSLRFVGCFDAPLEEAEGP